MSLAKITYTKHPKSKRIKRKKSSEKIKVGDYLIGDQQNAHMSWFNNFPQRQDIIKQLHILYKSNGSHRNCLGLLLDTSFKTVINNQVSYLCRKCDKTQESSQRAIIHYNRKHGPTPQNKTKNQKKDLECNDCDKTFASDASKRRHLAKNNCKHLCDLCHDERTFKLRDCEEHYICDFCWDQNEECMKCMMDKE